MKTLQEAVNMFLTINSPDNLFGGRGWLTCKEGDVYVRATFHYFQGKRKTSLDIANINLKEKFRGKGVFTALLKSLSSMNREMVLVESVHDKRFQDFLLKNGFITEDSAPINYFIERAKL